MQVVALPIRGLVIYPGMLRVLAVGRATSLRAVDLHLERAADLAMVVQRDADIEDPLQAEIASIGVLGQIHRITRLPDGTARVLVEGLQRVGLKGAPSLSEGCLVVGVEQAIATTTDPVGVGAAARALSKLYAEHMTGSGVSAQDHDLIAVGPSDPEHLADQVASLIEMSQSERIRLLEEPNLDARLRLVSEHLAVSVAQQKMTLELQSLVSEAMDKSQREYHLKEQLKVLRAELGEAVGGQAEADAFEERILGAGMPADVEKEAMREATRLRHIHSDSAEYTILRTWLEAVCELPWSKTTDDVTDLRSAQVVLDTDHYGLDRVKERILEYLAVRQLQPESKGPILCFVGPPGVGKTSLGMSIARALGRQFTRIALGGIKDETEIRGHRRTYIGALPGRIIRGMTRAGSRNPVVVLDEIDKVGNDFRGDPASALLEVLDPEQNSTFQDHYLDLPFDLSQVLFIGTANLIDPIPAALSDRLEIIEIPGYTEEEKMLIAKRFLLPKLAANHGLSDAHMSVQPVAVQKVIADYTREAGLRELERQLAKVHRKIARQVVEGRKRRVRVTPAAIRRYLGPPRYYSEVVERVDQPGVVTGLAWTAAGGDILFVEAIRMPGKTSLKLTGSLGDVMKESAEAAMSWMRAHATDYDVPASAFSSEFHLHVPAGAIPKDGPSAGVTMATAIASLVMGRPVKPRLAMTGEITLRGRVLPIGGVKEKALAARRAGVQTIILPAHNESDLEDIPSELRKDLVFHFVNTVTEVLELALAEA